jgi:tetratricopeptide (TPR) repeat protein
MNAPINITSEEWNDIETWLDQESAFDKTPILNEKLIQIPNVAIKIEYVKGIRIEIEDSIRQWKIKEFHHDSFDVPDKPNIPNNSDSSDSCDSLNNPDNSDYYRDRNRNQENSDYKNGSDIKNITTRKIKSNTVWYAGAAVLIAVLGFFWILNMGKTSERIFAKNFKPDIGLPLKMSTGNTYGFYEGMLDYKQENYEEAIEKWQVLLEAKPKNDTLNYFLGVAYLALGNAAKSLEFLENQERFRQGIFKEDAAYYTALAKIKEGKLEEARVFLQKYPAKRNTALLNELYEY